MYFKPYGGVRWAQSGILGPDSDSATRRSYTGQYEETSQWLGSLMHYKARYYSPFLHRFTQPDTIVPGAGNPQNLNRFLYSNGNPIRYSDPTGHCPLCLLLLGMLIEAAPELATIGIMLGVTAIGTDALYHFDPDSHIDATQHDVIVGVTAPASLMALEVANLGFSVRMPTVETEDVRAPDPSKVRSWNQFHYDPEDGGPAQLEAMYPETQFAHTPRGTSGADVRYVGGVHPSEYPNSTWAPGNNFGDFKPNTNSGYNRFNNELSNGKLPWYTQELPYDDKTFTLLSEHRFGPR